jgi:hypothetical protein
MLSPTFILHFVDDPFEVKMYISRLFKGSFSCQFISFARIVSLTIKMYFGKFKLKFQSNFSEGLLRQLVRQNVVAFCQLFSIVYIQTAIKIF